MRRCSPSIARSSVRPRTPGGVPTMSGGTTDWPGLGHRLGRQNQRAGFATTARRLNVSVSAISPRWRVLAFGLAGVARAVSRFGYPDTAPLLYQHPQWFVTRVMAVTVRSPLTPVGPGPSSMSLGSEVSTCPYVLGGVISR